MRSVRLGHIHADCVGFAQAVDLIEGLVQGGRGGYVVTPNVDHVALAEENDALRAAYAGASLSLVDGMPLVWAARLLGCPLPEKVSGSDLVRPLVRRAAARGWRTYLLGAAPGVGSRAATQLLRETPGWVVAGIDAPQRGFEAQPVRAAAVVRRIRAAEPDLVLVALGCPKQEIWMLQNRSHYAPAVAVGIGAALDFVAGATKRAPPWVSQMGLEWLYRLAHEPRRLASRYLVRDRAIAPVLWRMWRMAPQERVYERGSL